MSVETMFGLILGTLTKIVFDPPVPKKKLNRRKFFMPAGPGGPLSGAPVWLACGPYVVRALCAGRLALMSTQRGSTLSSTIIHSLLVLDKFSVTAI